MESMIEVGKSYLQTAISWAQEGLNSNPDMFVMVVGGILLIVILLALKELFDIMIGANKGALKKRIQELEEDCEELNERNVFFENYVKDLEDHTNALKEKLAYLKAINFDKVFSEEFLKELAEKQRVVKQKNKEKKEENHVSHVEII